MHSKAVGNICWVCGLQIILLCHLTIGPSSERKISLEACS